MENQGVLFDAPDNTTTLEYDFSILFLWGLGLGFLYAMAIEGPFWRPCLPGYFSSYYRIISYPHGKIARLPRNDTEPRYIYAAQTHHQKQRSNTMRKGAMQQQ
ncbi:uncharacterized protein LOC143841218 isoform X1 [Paroedura picta]|uniref:uncharacterized protein LOC143841218 isoform X1 n=1 Tax=Paroedura picta TaxID=143630 RepID=UPI004055B7BC